MNPAERVCFITDDMTPDEVARRTVEFALASPIVMEYAGGWWTYYHTNNKRAPISCGLNTSGWRDGSRRVRGWTPERHWWGRHMTAGEHEYHKDDLRIPGRGYPEWHDLLAYELPLLSPELSIDMLYAACKKPIRNPVVPDPYRAALIENLQPYITD